MARRFAEERRETWLMEGMSSCACDDDEYVGFSEVKTKGIG